MLSALAACEPVQEPPAALRQQIVDAAARSAGPPEGWR
jgi:hypothetical protein